jgi:hypothetical protein
VEDDTFLGETEEESLVEQAVSGLKEAEIRIPRPGRTIALTAVLAVVGVVATFFGVTFIALASTPRG